MRYTAEAIRTAVELASRYINDRRLPDKAIDVIDEVGASQRLLPESKRRKTVGVKDVEGVVAKIARIPPKNVSRGDKTILESLERDLKTVVFGQDTAIAAVATAIKMARAAPREPASRRPTVGAHRGGKDERAPIALLRRALRFDMRRYRAHSVLRLIGAPPGYVGFDQGGLLTDAADQNPHMVLLLDEIEKAHPDLFNILLQIMDYGKLTDHNGKTVDFGNVILIMTTNAGAAELAKPPIGFARTEREGDDEEAIKRMFAPEFRNRLDAVIRFAALSPEVIVRVVDKFIIQLEEQLADRNVTIELSAAARTWLAEKGYDPTYGARPLARLIQEEVKKPLADELLFGKLAKGGRVQVGLKDGKLTFSFPAPMHRAAGAAGVPAGAAAPASAPACLNTRPDRLHSARCPSPSSPG